MTQEIYLTGITTTGTPHIGNYVGAIRPGIEASKDLTTQHFYFLADYHSLAKNEDPDKIARSTLEIAASWLALGLDTDHACFYRQSDIPEIPELTWILTGMTAKGLMNRAHSYKAAVQANEESGNKDPGQRRHDGALQLPDTHGCRHPHVQVDQGAGRPGPEAACGNGA